MQQSTLDDIERKAISIASVVKDPSCTDYLTEIIYQAYTARLEKEQQSPSHKLGTFPSNVKSSVKAPNSSSQEVEAGSRDEQ